MYTGYEAIEYSERECQNESEPVTHIGRAAKGFYRPA